MYYLPKQADERHEFANSEAHGGDIHISKATKSGRLDYICLGCKKPMQAILRKSYDAKPYFRHDTKDVPHGERCTFRDEDYRSKLALTTIDLEKMLYVPPLYKHPPKGIDGPIIKLMGGQMLYPARVAKFQYFYEDNEGQVKTSSEFHEDLGDLLFFADLVLYDENDQPMLTVTLKRVKKSEEADLMAALIRLRINAIYLSIPQDSPEAIHRSLMNGKNAKWLYHDDERQFDYLRLSEGFTDILPAIDREPGHLLEESFTCRTAQINNLIRSLNKCVGTEPYQQTERRAREAIGKAELAIVRAGERREDLSGQHRTRLEEHYQPEFDRIEERRGVLELALGDLRRVQADLERRYQQKNSQLTAETGAVDAELRAASLAAGGTGRTSEELEDDVMRAHDQAIERLGRAFGRGVEVVENKRRRTEDDIHTARGSDAHLRKRTEGLPDEFKHIEKTAAAEFNEQAEREERERTVAEAAIDQQSASLEAEARQIEVDFNTAHPKDSAGLPAGLDQLISDGPFLAALEAQRDYQRIRTAKEFLTSATGQAWLRSCKR